MGKFLSTWLARATWSLGEMYTFTSNRGTANVPTVDTRTLYTVGCFWQASSTQCSDCALSSAKARR